MAVCVRPYVVSIDHVVGCNKRRCGPECRRRTEGWEYEIKMKLPSGKFFQERRKSSLASKTNTARFAEERALFVTRESVIPVAVAKKVVPTVADFEKQFMVFSKTNNKPSTVYAKEWMLRVHVTPYFGSQTLDQIGPADIEDYKAKKTRKNTRTSSMLQIVPPTHWKCLTDWIGICGVARHLSAASRSTQRRRPARRHPPESPAN